MPPNPAQPLCSALNSGQLHISAKHTRVERLVSSPKTSRARGTRGELRSRAGMAQRVRGRWKRSSRWVRGGKKALWHRAIGG